MKILLVEWEDSSFQLEGWQHRETILKIPLAHCVSIGFVEEVTSESLHLIPNLGKGVGSQACVIPRRNVKRIRQLKIGQLNNE